VSREDERNAFARACAYLNYKVAAKWTAYLAAVLTSLLFIALLVLLLFFADEVAHRGLLPEFRDLTTDTQERILNEWRDLDEESRQERLKAAGLKVESSGIVLLGDIQKRVVLPGEEGKEPRVLTPWSVGLAKLDRDLIWRAELNRLLAENVGE